MNPRVLLWSLVAFTGLAAGAPRAYAQPRPHAVPPAHATAAAQRIRRAAVAVLSGTSEHRGHGVVLSVDGRVVVTAASIHGVRDLRLRYPDGRVERARVLATDPGWGVALLEPAAGRWPEGLPLGSHEPPRGSPVLWSTHDGDGVTTAGELHRRRTFVGPGGALLRDAWELTPSPLAGAAGSAVVDQAGDVVAVVVSPPPGLGHDGPGAPYGVPASVLRDLRARVLGPDQPWLGLTARELRPGEENLASASCGVRVTDVTVGSPAHRAGLRPGDGGDVIVGVDGQPVRTCDELASRLQTHRSGEVVVIQVTRAGAQADIPVQLDALPGTVVASQPGTDAVPTVP